MSYTVLKLAKLSGVSARTLRYYDEIGLLTPDRVEPNGYRVYEQKQVDRLQQILLYRELGMPLESIQSILDAKGFDRGAALRAHLRELSDRKQQLERLMENVRKTLRTMEGETTMTDKEKFEGFKRQLVDDNERKYGAEARKRYGDAEVDASNGKVMGMSEGQYQQQQELQEQIAALLKTAVATGDPACADAQKACELHKQWLELFWRKGMYSKQAHLSLGETYVQDERFRAHYEAIAPGCAEFFRNALRVYCKE